MSAGGDDTVMNETMDLLAGAKDLGWSRRNNGGFSRLLKFSKPISKDVLAVLVPALCLDGPEGRHVKPGEHKHEVSADRLFLRIIVKPRIPTPPAAILAALPDEYDGVSLFGAKYISSAVLS